MEKERLEQKLSGGFGLVGIIIAFAVVVLAGGGGLYWKEMRNQKSVLQSGSDAIKQAEELKEKIERQNEAVADESAGSKLTGGVKQTMQTQVRTATSTEGIDTSNWKTYRNEKYGFEVKYPSKWRLYEVNKEIIEMHEGSGASDFGSFEIIADSDFLKVISGHLVRYVHGTKIQKEEMIIVGGESGKLIYQNTGGQNLLDSSPELSRWFFIPHGGKIFKIGIYWRNKERDDFFNQMISTFKFLE